MEVQQVQSGGIEDRAEVAGIGERPWAGSWRETYLDSVETRAVAGMCLILDRNDYRDRAETGEQPGLRDDCFEYAPVRTARPGREQPNPLTCQGRLVAQACTTFCSIAPKIE